MAPDRPLTPADIEAAKTRRLEAMHLQEIEGNPLDANDVAMFEMFEREGWSHQRCIDYLVVDADKLRLEGRAIWMARGL